MLHGVPSASKVEAGSVALAPVQVQAFTALMDDKCRCFCTLGSCFYCRQPGHMIENCPSRKERKEKKDDTGALIARLLALGGEDKEKMKEGLKDF